MADTEKPDLDDLLAGMDDTLDDLQDRVQRLKEAMEDVDDVDPNIRPILQARLSVDTAYAAEATIFCLSFQYGGGTSLMRFNSLTRRSRGSSS